MPCIPTGKSVFQFANYVGDGAYQWSFRSCRKFTTAATIANPTKLAEFDAKNCETPDIAIARIDEIWPVFVQAGRNSTSCEYFDLDQPTTVDWDEYQNFLLAFGYPTDHKHEDQSKVAAKLAQVVVELASEKPTENHPVFTLCSNLGVEHGWGFSGVSGGPVMLAHKTLDEVAFVGIVYEGTPSGSDTGEQNSEAIFGADDIVLKCYQITPAVFSNWLELAQHQFAYPPTNLSSG